MNQVEIWYSILSRKLLKRGNFISVADLPRPTGQTWRMFLHNHKGQKRVTFSPRSS